MKTKYKISNGENRWEVTFSTEQEWLDWKAQADAAGWYGEGYVVVEEVITKTTQEALAEGKAALEAAGFDSDTLQLLIALSPSMSIGQFTKYQANLAVVTAMYQAAWSSPATFDIANFAIPHTKQEILT